VIGMAYQALYYAKHNGRNQTSSYEDLLAQGKIVITEYIDNSNADMFVD
jgi:hypothetical protein